MNSYPTHLRRKIFQLLWQWYLNYLTALFSMDILWMAHRNKISFYVYITESVRGRLHPLRVKTYWFGKQMSGNVLLTSKCHILQLTRLATIERLHFARICPTSREVSEYR